MKKSNSCFANYWFARIVLMFGLLSIHQSTRREFYSTITLINLRIIVQQHTKRRTSRKFGEVPHKSVNLSKCEILPKRFRIHSQTDAGRTAARFVDKQRLRECCATHRVVMTHTHIIEKQKKIECYTEVPLHYVQLVVHS